MNGRCFRRRVQARRCADLGAGGSDPGRKHSAALHRCHPQRSNQRRTEQFFPACKRAQGRGTWLVLSTDRTIIVLAPETFRVLRQRSGVRAGKGWSASHAKGRWQALRTARLHENRDCRNLRLLAARPRNVRYSDQFRSRISRFSSRARQDSRLLRKAAPRYLAPRLSCSDRTSSCEHGQGSRGLPARG